MVRSDPPQPVLSQMRRGVLEYCVLAMLQIEERYAFDIVRELGQTDVLVSPEGTIYPLLARLRREGSVATTLAESESGPARRYYRLTRSGEAALCAFENEWIRFRDAVDERLGTRRKR